MERLEQIEEDNLRERFGPPIIDSNGNVICGSTDTIRGDICQLGAGWGTSHSGIGPCQKHGGSIETTLAKKNGTAYSIYVQHERLKKILTEEEANAESDNLDGEISLIRGMIRLMAEEFGFEIDEDMTQERIFGRTATQVQQVAKLVDRMAGLIERKYRVAAIAGEMVPREAVRAYIQSLQNVLITVLTNETRCPKCKAQIKHDMYDKAFAAMRLVGSL